jgi:hypothetical protein
MKQKRKVKFLVCYKDKIQVLSIWIKNNDDLALFKSLKFKNIINLGVLK